MYCAFFSSPPWMVSRRENMLRSPPEAASISRSSNTGSLAFQELVLARRDPVGFRLRKHVVRRLAEDVRRAKCPRSPRPRWFTRTYRRSLAFFTKMIEGTFSMI